MAINISEYLYKELEGLRHRFQARDIEDVIEKLVSIAKDNTPVKPSTKLPSEPKISRYISQITKKIVIKDNKKSGCVYKEPQTGKICRAKENLEFDHIKPHSHGGPNISNNLQLLCSHHNKISWQEAAKAVKTLEEN